MAAAINSNPLKPNVALLELSLISAETSGASFDDVMVEALKRGIPAEIATRLAEIWQKAWTDHRWGAG
jgi:hypothetical protein